MTQNKILEDKYEELLDKYNVTRIPGSDGRIWALLQEEDLRLGDLQKRFWNVESMTMLGFLAAYYQGYEIMSLVILVAGLLSTYLFISLIKMQLEYTLNPIKYICRTIFRDYKIITDFRDENTRIGQNIGKLYLAYLLLFLWMAFFIATCITLLSNA